MPLALRNVALQQAGFASIYTGCELVDAVLAPAREAVGRLLDAHDPIPAMVLDAAWNVLHLNRGARWPVLTLMPWAKPMLLDPLHDQLLAHPVNLLDAMLHPEGPLRNVTNLAAVAPALLAHLRDDAMVLPELAPRVEQLAANLQQRLGKKPIAQRPRQRVPVLTTRLATA